MNASESYACVVLFLSLPLAVGSSMIIAGVLWALHPMAGIGAGLMSLPFTFLVFTSLVIWGMERLGPPR